MDAPIDSDKAVPIDEPIDLETDVTAQAHLQRLTALQSMMGQARAIDNFRLLRSIKHKLRN